MKSIHQFFGKSSEETSQQFYAESEPEEAKEYGCSCCDYAMSKEDFEAGKGRIMYSEDGVYTCEECHEEEEEELTTWDIDRAELEDAVDLCEYAQNWVEAIFDCDEELEVVECKDRWQSEKEDDEKIQEDWEERENDEYWEGREDEREERLEHIREKLHEIILEDHVEIKINDSMLDAWAFEFQDLKFKSEEEGIQHFEDWWNGIAWEY